MPSVLLDLVYVMYKGRTKKLMITGVGIEKKDQRVTEKKNNRNCNSIQRRLQDIILGESIRRCIVGKKMYLAAYVIFFITKCYIYKIFIILF